MTTTKGGGFNVYNKLQQRLKTLLNEHISEQHKHQNNFQQQSSLSADRQSPGHSKTNYFLIT